MTITLSPENEKLIEKRLETGAFENVQDLIRAALASLDAEDQWLQENRAEIQRKIELGLAQLDRGEGISGEVSRARLQEKKAAWLAQRQRP